MKFTYFRTSSDSFIHYCELNCKIVLLYFKELNNDDS